jgi:hypothetical protein
MFFMRYLLFAVCMNDRDVVWDVLDEVGAPGHRARRELVMNNGAIRLREHAS